ncbi:hypothetical protein L873DRAFT_1849621 [Choiromyces venosus 120613-1]|uniref:Uncharacterized protein n=1 Tax=Choiromyces venosus 120613-1 TaxID=1336337 RepID=A0A3N4J4C2_9PEZI|nr:hypothetical protein L873DRAFT_1849621 [Choiromyces venosus 120613-1]
MRHSYSENSAWTKDEVERLIQWFEDPANQQKTKKGSGITKKMIVTEIAAQIPTKEAVKVGYKYDNLMKSYRAAAKLNNQTGWGLSEQDLDEGHRCLRDKLLSRCPYFFRLERILGDRPNVWPPILFDSGANVHETAVAVEQLLGALGNDNHHYVPEQDRQQLMGLAEDQGSLHLGEDYGSGQNIRGGTELGGGLIARELEEVRSYDSSQGRSMSNERGEEECVIGGGERERVISQEEVRNNDGEVRLADVSGGSGSGGRDLQTQSAIRGPRRRRFPELLQEDDDGVGGVSGTQKRRKGTSNVLVDAVGILASARAEGDEKKYSFLDKHLVQQGELRRQEIELEREKLELERERARAEQRQTDLLILQLRASMGGKNDGRCRSQSGQDDMEQDLNQLDL